MLEDGIYVVVSVLLVVAGAVVLWNAVSAFSSTVQKGQDPLLDVLDKGLILFIIAELLHTVRVTIQQRTLVAEPFLIVGLIAGIRRLLILTAQATQSSKSPTPFDWSHGGLELTLLIGLVLAMTASLILYHRFYAATPGKADSET